MGGLTLLAEARAAGLALRAAGPRLVIRGPKAAGPTVRRLIAAKLDVLAAMEAEAVPGGDDRGMIAINPESYEPDEQAPEREPDGWRWKVACWPHERWARWRRRSSAIQARSGVLGVGVAEIEAADRLAYDEMQADDPPGNPHAAGSFDRMLWALSARGLRIDGEITRPRVESRTVTGRVTYSGMRPAPQGLPKADRPRRITPVVEGRTMIRADYGQIEPRIILSILRRRGLISWDAGVDLYRDLEGRQGCDREATKLAVNKAINGGYVGPGETPRLADFLGATEALREEVARHARATGGVTTLGGRAIALEADARNFGGRAVNRVVQGTAADVFNRAAAAVSARLEEEGLPAAVAFLLYDEMWVEADPSIAVEVSEIVRAEMGRAAEADGLVIPVRFDGPTPAQEP